MFRACILVLTACLFTTPVMAQEESKSPESSEAIFTQLRENLSKVEAALKAARNAEAQAREEAVAQRAQAEKALYAAEVEQVRAIQAQNEAQRQQELADQRRLEAQKQAELAKAAEAAARQAAENTKAQDAQPKRGKKRKAKLAELTEQVETLTKQMKQLQDDVNLLKAQLQNDPMKPGLGVKGEFKTDREVFPEDSTPFSPASR